MSAAAGKVLALAVRPADTPVPVESARAIAGLGLANDRHADPRSPRQLLLAGAPAFHDLNMAPLTLRENLLLDLDTAALESGMLLRIGPEVTLRLTFQCEACGAVAARLGGPARALRGRRGMLARVETGGMLRAGDPVTILAARATPLSDDWHDRVAMVLDAVPPGMVITYADLARVAGVQSSYCRAFPRALAKLGPTRAARAIPARADTPAPRWDGAGFFDTNVGVRSDI
ncbi:MOSC domain-containing protein [uncultured Massilia sp.]|uniref:MOSC domain-containing protein n=1 Tax=uncultured Massilia sp. TaxID=169973 RepID=UPI002587F8FA|nr:MOSC domain-containing protein [uncultured Massilia sp.]